MKIMEWNREEKPQWATVGFWRFVKTQGGEDWRKKSWKKVEKKLRKSWKKVEKKLEKSWKKVEKN